MENYHKEPGPCIAAKGGKLDVVNTKSIVTGDYARPSMEKADGIFFLNGNVRNTEDEIYLISEENYAVKRSRTTK